MQEQDDLSIKIGDQYEGWIVQKLVEQTVLSEVWKVKHFLTGTEAALKVIAEGLIQNQYFLDKFAAEVTIIQTLKHANILAGMGCFPVGHRYGVVTPWVDGWTLQKLIRANPEGIPLEDALPMAVTVLETLAKVHAHNIVHRDIKPNNILIEAATLKPFLIDFGIALVVGEPRKTKYGMVLGNPDYMSPEQIQRFHEADSRSDIYAFGCVLFEMLTGRPPFVSDAATDTEQLYAVQRMQIYDDPPLLRSIRPSLPVQLERVVAMALEKDPDQRYASCMEFAEFLKAVEIASAPIQQASVDVQPAKPDPEPEPEAPPPPPDHAVPPRINSALQLSFGLAFVLGLVPLWIDISGKSLPTPKALLGDLPAFALGTVISLLGYLTLIYRCWSVLPEEETNTTGTMAVVYHLLFPIASFKYFAGFLRAYNQHVSQHRLDLREYPEILGTVWWFIPFGFVAIALSSFDFPDKVTAIGCLLLVWSLIYELLVWRMCEAANQLIDLQSDDAEAKMERVAANQ